MIIRPNGSLKAGRSCLSRKMQAIQSLFEHNSNTLTWTNMPSALTEVNINPNINRRNVANFKDTEYFWFSVVCVNAGAANAEITIQYSTNSGSSWNQFLLSDGVTEPWAPLDAGVTTYFNFPVPSAARIDSCWLRAVGRNGDGTTDPSFQIYMGAVNRARSITQGEWNGAYPASRRSWMSNKRDFHHGNTTTSFSGTWTNMPSALTAVPNPPMASNNPISSAFHETLKAAHAGWFRHRCNVGVAGFAGSKLQFQYSTNSGSSWQFIDSAAGNTGAPIAIDGAGLKFSSFVKIDDAFYTADPAQLQTRLVGQGGNGVVDPTFIIYGAESVEYDPALY